MIIAHDFRLDYDELLKGMAPAAPPAPAAGGGAMPTGQPRAGHKYVRRWWDGSGWQYEYPGEGTVQHGGQVHFSGHERHEHTLALPEGHQYGPGQEQQAYHETHAAAHLPGQQHEVPHPTGQGSLKVKMLGGGRVQVAADNGKAQTFASPSAYERWFRGIAMGAVEIPDHEGKPFLTVTPAFGDPDENGLLRPTSDPNRQWVVKIARGRKDALAQSIATGGRNEVGDRYTTKERAMADVANRMRFLEQQHGVKFNWEHPSMPQQPAGAAPPAQMAARVVAQQPEAGAQAPQQPAGPREGDVDIGGMQQKVWQNYQNQTQDPKAFEQLLHQFSWEDVADPEQQRMVRRLKATPEQKQQLVDQLGIQFTPLARKIANGLAPQSGGRQTPSGVSEGGGGRMQSPRDQFLEQMFGDVPPDNDAPFLPAEGSFLRQRLESMLDNYDPSKTKGGFAAYVKNSLQQDMKKFAMAQHEQNKKRQSQIQQDEEGNQRDVSEQGLTAEGATPERQDLEGQQINWQDWGNKQTARVYQLVRDKNLPKEVANYLLQVVPRITDERALDKFGQGMVQHGWGDYIWGKSLQLASQVWATELRKAGGVSPYLTPDKGVDPTHMYDHMEGDKDHPRYYYRDQTGNMLRYTNAPSGHADASQRFGDAKMHDAEPTMDRAPQFFDPQGRKLTRAPYPGSAVEWNPQYHPHDPQNMWAGRWVNPLTGEHEHTYVDSDMRMVPKLYLHQAIALVDVRLPVLRDYYSRLFMSPMLKDKIVATALALIDQGRFRAEELTVLTPADVVDRGALFKIGNRFIYADQKLRAMLQLMTQNRSGIEPLFAVPYMKNGGDPDALLLRRIGPHFLQCAFDRLGISLSALHVYHATQLFSREVQRLLVSQKIPWESALEYATVAVAQEMGHDLQHEPDVAQALPLIRDLLIDPVVIDVLQQNAKKAGVLGNVPIMLPLPPPAIALVSLDLKTRTADEDEFSKWLHGYPAHLHADVEQFVAPRRPPLTVPNKANQPDAQPPQPEADPSQQNGMAPPADSAEKSLPSVIKTTRTEEIPILVCPHCRDEIREKALGMNEDGTFFHRGDHHDKSFTWDDDARKALMQVPMGKSADEHFINKCSCGAVISQCRCKGPKVERIIENGCEDCQAKTS